MSTEGDALRNKIADLASEHVGERVYPLRAPQADDQPCVVYRRTKHNRLTLGGELWESEYEITIVGESLGLAETVGDLIFEGLDGWTDSEAGVQSCQADSEDDNFNAPDDGSDDGLVHIAQSYVVTHT